MADCGKLWDGVGASLIDGTVKTGNPPGIPYLYVGSTPETSIAEIRPHTGETATLAEFEIDASALAVVDLRSPKHLISPFTLGDEDKVGLCNKSPLKPIVSGSDP